MSGFIFKVGENMEIKFKLVDSKIFIFSVDDDEIGTVYKTIDRHGLNNWTAVEEGEGLCCEGKTKKEAVQNLMTQMALNQVKEELFE
jgi:hypothetical protein